MTTQIIKKEVITKMSIQIDFDNDYDIQAFKNVLDAADLQFRIESRGTDFKFHQANIIKSLKQLISG